MGTPAPQGPVSVLLAGGHVGIDPASPFLDYNLYKVNVPGIVEQITQPLYSYQLYPAAGSAQLTFFSTPIGGNIAGGAAFTFDDTNMTLASQLPAPQMFLIQGIGIDYLPGNTSAAPEIQGVSRANTINGWTLDFYTIFRKANLQLSIGTKNYLTLGPLMAFPPRSHLQASNAAADSTTAGASQFWKTDIGWSEGDVFTPTPILLEAGQNFNVTLNWPGGAIATTSTDALARIGVILYGTLFRSAQ